MSCVVRNTRFPDTKNRHSVLELLNVKNPAATGVWDFHVNHKFPSWKEWVGVKVRDLNAFARTNGSFYCRDGHTYHSAITTQSWTHFVHLPNILSPAYGNIAAAVGLVPIYWVCCICNSCNSCCADAASFFFLRYFLRYLLLQSQVTDGSIRELIEYFSDCYETNTLERALSFHALYEFYTKPEEMFARRAATFNNSAQLVSPNCVCHV